MADKIRVGIVGATVTTGGSGWAPKKGQIRPQKPPPRRFTQRVEALEPSPNHPHIVP